MIRRALARPLAMLRRLQGDRSGVTLVEFAFVGPVLILMIMGLFDIAHTQYTASLMNGAMQKAGRDLTLEGASLAQGNIDEKVETIVQQVVPSTATVTMEKLSHFDFSDVGEAEEYTDENEDGRCNFGELFVDANSNGRYDTNRGKEGIGGARDVVVYTAVVTYPRMFPLYGLIGLGDTVTLRASTVLRNQPFDEQDQRSTDTGNCP